MAIRIVRNEAGNCINFFGSSNPTYWNACLSGEVDAVDTNTVNVINDIITAQTGETEYEFFRIPYTDLTDAEGNSFANAQEAADYITDKANVVGLGGGGTDLTGQSVCFKLDDTSTSIMLDNGYSFGVNTIKAVDTGDGLITIQSELGDIIHFTKLDHTNVCDGEGNALSGGLNDVINYLNELFTVGAFESVVISDPYSTMIADVDGVVDSGNLVGSAVVDPIGNDIGGNTTTHNNNAGYLSSEVINQAGEYFTFDIRGEGQIGFGLVHTTDSYNDGHYSGSATYADPATFCNGANSSHYGFQFSHFFHPTPNGSWTNYGSNTSYSIRSGWYDWDQKQDWIDGNPVKIKVGIDHNGYIEVSSLKDDGTFEQHVRTSYVLPEGGEYRLGIKFSNPYARLYSQPKVHLLEESAPTMYFRYIESPDGVFHFPIFATEEEANYYDANHSGVTGSGTSSTIVFPDDPTLSTWYIPTTGYENNSFAAPVGDLFMGNFEAYTEISSLTNQDLAPSAFDIPDYTVDELSSINIQLAPQDVSYAVSVSGLPQGLILVGHHIEGSAPEVTGDYDANPSDDYTITVTRTNSYGSASDTFILSVTNLTAPVVAISGFNHVSGSTALIDSDTMDDGSVVHVNNTVADGERFVIEKAYVETNILPALQAAGDQYIIGLHNTASDFSTLEIADFDAAIVWEYESASSHTFKFYRDGGLVQNIVIGSATQAFYDYAIETDGTSAWLIACNINSIMNEPSPSEGGVFSYTYEVTNTEDTAPLQIHMAALNTSADISTTGIETITTPAPTGGLLTNWTKALDFSGSSERAQMVSSSATYLPIAQNVSSTNTWGSTGSTSSHSSGRPWATAVVFKIDGNNSNQHIWNQGEGAGDTDDNIYLRVDAAQNLYFGWGRSGALNEVRIATAISSAFWYGVYIGYDGRRWAAAGATAGNLYQTFDIKMMTGHDNFGTLYTEGEYTDWNAATASTGGRMDRTILGDFTIGGRGSNRNFHGKVASFVATTLKGNVSMPNDTEIEMMIKDPMQWIQDYKVGNTYRAPNESTNRTNWQIGATSFGWYPAAATQVWLMGDGPNDSYANGVKNQVNTSDSQYTKLDMLSMVSNDVENVSIGGLS